MGSNITKIQFIRNKLMSHFPIIYLLSKPNKQTFDNIKGYNTIKKYDLFDKNYYLNKYKDVKDSGMNPIIHYMLYGFKEGKKPNKNFDGIYYSHKYADALNSKLSPLVHYSLYGIQEDRNYKLNQNIFPLIPFETTIDILNNFADSNLSKSQLIINIQKQLETINYHSFNQFNYKNSKKRILYLVHEKIGNFGGTGFTNNDIIDNIQDSYECFILTSTGEELELWKKDYDHFEKLGQWDVNLTDDLSSEENINFKKQIYSNELLSIYFTIIVNLNIDLIHINHLINHTFDIAEVAKKLKIPVVLSIHDFYYICPSIHLLNKNHEYCNLICNNNDWTCGGINSVKESNLKNTIQSWRNESFNFLNNCSIIITPSQSSADIYKIQYPNIKTNIKIIEHGRDLPKRLNYSSFPKKGKIKILFPGYIGMHKGSLLIRDLKKIDKDNKFEFHFIGTSYPSLKSYGKNHGRYVRDDFGKFVRNINPSFIGIFSTIPETYSHTLTESWNCGVPVLATNLGALKERISKTGGGWLVDYQSPKKIYDKIMSIVESPEEYNEVVNNISKIKFKSKKEMANEYKEIYDNLTFEEENLKNV